MELEQLHDLDFLRNSSIALIVEYAKCMLYKAHLISPYNF